MSEGRKSLWAQVLGFHRDRMDAAATKRGRPGESGRYRDSWQGLKNSKFTEDLDFDPKDIAVMNPGSAFYSKNIAPILAMDNIQKYIDEGFTEVEAKKKSLQDKKDAWKKLTESEDFKNAQDANKKAMIYLINKVYDAYNKKDGISDFALYNLFQSQTNLAYGF